MMKVVLTVFRLLDFVLMFDLDLSTIYPFDLR